MLLMLNFILLIITFDQFVEIGHRQNTHPDCSNELTHWHLFRDAELVTGLLEARSVIVDVPQVDRDGRRARPLLGGFCLRCSYLVFNIYHINPELIRLITRQFWIEWLKLTDLNNLHAVLRYLVVK